MAENIDFFFKIIIIGDSSVGKSKLLYSYLGKEEKKKPTIGVDMCYKDTKIDGQLIRLQFWDTCGEERYKSITCAYYKKAVGAFVVYDITSKKSFESIDNWIEVLNNECGNENIVIILLGNKCDCKDERKITEKEGKEKAIKQKIIFFEVKD